jgi:iron complex outermembrane receptor protein
VLSANELREVAQNQGSLSDRNKLGSGSTDWQDQIFKNAFRPGSEYFCYGAVLKDKLPFRLSGNYLNQDGILKTGNFQRQALGSKP